MTIKERTTLFNIFVGLFNIILGLLIEVSLVIACFFILSKIPNSANSLPTQIILPFVLLIGFLIAMTISIKTITWVIKKFNLETKLDQKIIKRYIKD